MKKRSLFVTAIGVVALSLSACVASAPPVTESAAPSGAETTQFNNHPAADILKGIEADASAAALLPARVTDAGALKVGSNIQVPPANFYDTDGKTPVGFEVDLSVALAKRLGVEAEFHDFAFEALITSLESGRIDFTIANMNDTAERQKKIDFVNYFNSGVGIMVQAANPAGITTEADLCGQKVSAGTGTSDEAWALEFSKECVAQGKKPIEVVTNTNTQQRMNELRTGRVAAELNTITTLVYMAATIGDGKEFKVVDLPPLNAALYGIGVNKSTPEIRDALKASLQSLIDDGTYEKIFTAWGVQAGMVKEATINAGG